MDKSITELGSGFETTEDQQARQPSRFSRRLPRALSAGTHRRERAFTRIHPPATVTMP